MELLALLAVMVAGYAVAGLLYRRYLLGRLSPPEPVRVDDEEPPSEHPDLPTGDGVLCPACGAANESGYSRCFNCANPLPGA